MISQVFSRAVRSITASQSVRSIWRRFPVGSVPLRTKYGIWTRPHYAYGVYAAAEQASALNIPAISAVELGVAGGNGLIALEAISRDIASYFGIHISVWGFDSGQGMPPPVDYRDLPHVWNVGFYKMDIDSLLPRLSSNTHLILGDIRDTLFETLPSMDPLGFIAYDLDYYSSTKGALKVFDGDQNTRLPRVICYFDDTISPERAYHNESTGELLAIKEFNEEHGDQAIHPIHMLRWLRPHAEIWNEQIYVMHDFLHSRYGDNVTKITGAATQLPLRR